MRTTLSSHNLHVLVDRMSLPLSGLFTVGKLAFIFADDVRATIARFAIDNDAIGIWETLVEYRPDCAFLK
jgi:hypothetical protein